MAHLWSREWAPAGHSVHYTNDCLERPGSGPSSEDVTAQRDKQADWISVIVINEQTEIRALGNRIITDPGLQRSRTGPNRNVRPSELLGGVSRKTESFAEIRRVIFFTSV